MSRLVTLCSKVKRISGAVAKASPNRANQLHGIDAKLSDLPLARMKRRVTPTWRSEPVLVENSLDELRVGVKG